MGGVGRRESDIDLWPPHLCTHRNMDRHKHTEGKRKSGTGSVGMSMSLLCSLSVTCLMGITSSKTQKNPDVQVEAAIKINLTDYLDMWRC